MIYIFGFFKKKKQEEKQEDVLLNRHCVVDTTFIRSQIDEEMYLNFAISSCFNEITRSFKTLEFGVYKVKNDNYKKSGSFSAKKIGRTIKRPNPHTTFSGIIDSYLAGIYFNGNCLLRKIPGVMNDDLYVYNNSYYQITRNPRTMVIEAIETANIVFSGNDLKNFKPISEFNYKSQVQGIDKGVAKTKCLEPIKKLINGSLAYNISVMNNGGFLGGFLNFKISPEDVTEREKENARKEFKEKYSGVGNAGKPFLTWGDATYQQTGTTPKDLDFTESMVQMQKNICRVMGVPETLIIGDNSSYNNTLEFKKKLYTELVIPLAKEFCEHLTELFRNDLAEDEELYFSTSNIKVLQSDTFIEIEKLVNSLTGVCTVNGIIKKINDKYQMELEDLGEQGNVVLTKYNYTLEDVGGKLEFNTTPNSEEDSAE
ncbi:MAG: phage portal protein [Cetobacterium sp.]|uniref:phage portal protein n=1 Tax=Cetobacterium sp. TaxID=2071632 RepID=UPI003EE6F8F7